MPFIIIIIIYNLLFYCNLFNSPLFWLKFTSISLHLFTITSASIYTDFLNFFHFAAPFVSTHYRCLPLIHFYPIIYVDLHKRTRTNITNALLFHLKSRITFTANHSSTHLYRSTLGQKLRTALAVQQITHKVHW